ncbi:cytochrome b/b6 domain-containing protein [Meridianimarinicoccus sp. MJW13]|uniref:cytochrome b/b6 domain-containing protein n=1 Tax=Meridianimarinicoccus sp. MJW13 TaxID=2720031 RepID=UPI001865D068|nr:cytochrome b/b6 domain-containing protein [Fluviibacterium sp. MJW13]
MSDATPLGNSAYAYGNVTKMFHWLTALLILTAFPLGMIANSWPYDSSQALLVKGVLFSLHKTVGVTVFFVALARILWALTQTKPHPLHPDRRIEHFMAELVHWLLYAGLILVPLSGWIHHAATTGFAPIWWPFGQSLPFVPKDDAVAHVFEGWHLVFTKVLGIAVLLHIVGAVKHQVIDRDLTLARMLPGRVEAGRDSGEHSRSPFWMALMIWAVAMTAGTALGWPRAAQTESPAIALAPAPVAPAATGWTVQGGTLGLSVVQFGADVEGSFSDWSASIAFDPEAPGPDLGTVAVDIAIGSVTLGSVTAEAVKPEFFDAAQFPTARFTATLRAGDDGRYLAEGTLSLKGADVPVTLPFDLTLTGDTAEMTGQTTLDRRDFDIGTATYKDEATLGFPVTVSVSLTAQRN